MNGWNFGGDSALDKLGASNLCGTPYNSNEKISKSLTESFIEWG